MIEMANEMNFSRLPADATGSVFLDLSDVSHISSSRIGSIITYAKSINNDGGRLVLLVGQNHRIRKILEAVGIDTLIPVCKDIAEATEILV